MSRAHGRGTNRTAVVAGAIVAAAAVVGGGVYLLTGTDDKASHGPSGKSRTPSSGPERTPGSSPTKTKDPRPPYARFAPYIDTTLSPPYDMVDTAGRTGVKEFNLAFISPGGGGCTPKWGGKSALTDNAVADGIDDLRAEGGDVRLSFGGQGGSELGRSCRSVSELADAYGRIIDTYRLTKIDFDIERDALTDTAANTRRAQAVARLQKEHPDLQVSYTLPVMPAGLNPKALDLLTDARKNGVKISAVNIMAMDYGTSFSDDMGRYAIQAATATQKQLKSALGLSDADAWKTLAVTPMIGLNDVTTETFTLDDAKELVRFAESKDLAWLSMWSSTRDKPCPGGKKKSAQATCSSILEDELAFTRVLGAYND
ncbi:chitinase [Streptomyces sp. NPDC048639]|uniref:chitinase n=1 Tax=Streptomyces sp. NPDC048639 TaxID=3365581 RepID=UPI003716B55F